MKELLSFGTCLALGLTVVGASSALADAATFYFDNDAAGWDAVCAWGWLPDDEMWAMDNGFEAWPGIALEKDATTGYYVYNCPDYVDGAAIMFNDNGAGKQTNDDASTAAAPGKVCVVTDTDADGKYNAEWKDVAGAATTDDKKDAAASTTTTSDDKKDDATKTTDDKKDDAATTKTTDDKKTETAAAGKTADTATVAAVAMLGLASMAVVVATRKKIA